jgi:hypothetical protein
VTDYELKLATELANELEVNGHPEALCVKAAAIMRILIREHKIYAPPHWELKFNEQTSG